MKATAIVLMILLFLALMAPIALCQEPGRLAWTEISIAIEKAKNEHSPRLRTENVEKVYALIEANSWEVSEDDIRDLAKMLGDPLGGVRSLSASSLGAVGPRARGAAPALRRALVEIECVIGDQTSESAIRAALASIGTPAPARNCSVASDIADAISRVKNEDSPGPRAEYAKRLFDLVKEDSDSGKIRVPEIYALGGSLGVQDDTARYWIVSSLGYIGPRAEIVVPELERELLAVECDPENKKSASAIRSALKEIGSDLPVSRCRQ